MHITVFKTMALVVVHVFGHPAKIDEQKGFVISGITLIDAAESLGSFIKIGILELLENMEQLVLMEIK